MITSFLFDLDHPKFSQQRPNIWFVVAALLAIGYMLFGLVLMGVQSVSRGGFVFAALCTLWLLVGLTSRTITFPPILLLPLAFFTYLVVTGLQLDPYPTEYILRMVTIWLGAICLAAFVANGLSLKLVIAGFVVVVIANMVAIYAGYDGALINKDDFDVEGTQAAEIARYSGLAGQQNLLLSLVFTLPFLVFALKQRVNVLVYVALAATAIAITFLTGSRSGIIFSILFIAAGSIFLVKRGPTHALTMTIGLACAIAVGVFFTDNLALSKLENSVLGEQVLVKRVFNKIDSMGVADDREVFKTEFWPYFDKKPLIGHGPGAFRDVTGFGTYAHNNFAEIAVNGGIVGLLLYYSMYLTVAFGVLNSLQKNIFLLAPLVFLILADNWYVTFVSRAMIICLCMLLIASFSLDKQGRGGKSRRRRRRVSR